MLNDCGGGGGRVLGERFLKGEMKTFKELAYDRNDCKGHRRQKLHR